jgi:hypothetical protein
VGLPYGSKPRLLIAFLASEAVKKGEREIVLGDSLSDFMRAIGLQSTGGRWGSIKGLKEQMDRLFSSSMHFHWQDKDSMAISNMPIVSKFQLWWDPKNPEQTSLWESKIRLGEEFLAEVLAHHFPVDLRVVSVLKQSPLALDIYFWLTHRLSYLKKSSSRPIPWLSLQCQFGSDYPSTRQGTRDFKKKFKAQLKYVLVVYPEANLQITEAGLILKPSETQIPKLSTKKVDN